MNALISCAAASFLMSPDGEIWIAHGEYDYRFWTRYLDVFDEIRLVARARPCAEVPADWHRASGPGVKAAPVADFRSPWSFAKLYRATQQVIHDTLTEAPAVIIRSSSFVGARSVVGKSGRPYGLEVVGDPYDSFAPGASRFWLRPFYRWWFARSLRQECAGACAAAYVTESRLQRRYPPATGAFTTHYSSIVLVDSQVASSARKYERETRPIQLILVASLSNLQKAPQIVLGALAQCAREGLDVRLTVAGGGKHRAELELLASRLGVSDRSRFLGHVVSREAVVNQLDEADLYVHPSFQEGLPRAMIEAMARGLPCIGSTVGGIPELLPAEDMVEPGDARALAVKIREVAADPARMTRMSKRNLAKAAEYRDVVLRQRRKEFYVYVRDRTEQWLRQTAQSK